MVEVLLLARDAVEEAQQLLKLYLVIFGSRSECWRLAAEEGSSSSEPEVASVKPPAALSMFWRVERRVELQLW